MEREIVSQMLTQEMLLLSLRSDQTKSTLERELIYITIKKSHYWKLWQLLISQLCILMEEWSEFKMRRAKLSSQIQLWHVKVLVCHSIRLLINLVIFLSTLKSSSQTQWIQPKSKKFKKFLRDKNNKIPTILNLLPKLFNSLNLKSTTSILMLKVNVMKMKKKRMTKEVTAKM